MRRRRVGFLLVFGALVPLAVSATAWACGVLATLRSDPGAANPGQVIRVTGANYSSNMSTFTPVEIRFNGRTGPVMEGGEAVVPSPGPGRIEAFVRVPRDAAGFFVLNAVQYRKSNGTPKSGTPGRATVRVQGAAAGAASPWSSTPGGGAGVAVDAGPGSPPLLPTLLGVALSLGLLGGGLTLVSRSRTRKANRPLLGI